MSRGIHVFGSASMGALRAAELLAFGMEGVGTIFEQYRDGLLEDDDEVAMVHGPFETGFRAGSEAMVNIRQTLRSAQRAGVISPKTQLTLEKIAKQMYYPNRSYSAVLCEGRRCGLPEIDMMPLERWLPEGQVNQKKNDAISMLRVMRHRLEQGLEPKRVIYSFEHTVMWQDSRERLEDRNGSLRS